jgi:hypothetical protein
MYEGYSEKLNKFYSMVFEIFSGQYTATDKQMDG